jgi:excisionase family DNA binding protein
VLLAFLLFEGEKRMEKENVTPLLLSIPQVAKALCLGRTKVYELIATEGLPVVRFGRAVRVSPMSLQQWLARREEGEHHPFDVALR